MRSPLGDIADVFYGKSPGGVLDVSGQVPIFGTGGVYGLANQRLFVGPAIVVPRKGSLGNPQYVDGPFWPSDTTYAVLPKVGTDARWLFYSLANFDLSKLNEATGVPSINRAWLCRIALRRTDLDEQERIAEILSTLGEAIEQTEALIAKTQAIKAGLMHDLFTRGITANGELRPPREEAPQLYKDSPLGWIPKEWYCRQLGELAEIVSGVTLGQSAGSTGVEVPYLRVANVQDGHFDLREIKSVGVAAAQLVKLMLQPGDVLMNEGGDFDKLGRGAVWSGEISPCIHQNHVFRVRPKAGSIRSQYLAYWSQTATGRRYFLISSKQSTNLASINSTQLHRFPIAVANEVEQVAIETRLLAVDAQVAQLQRELSIRESLKHGLMHDLLTGRVAVPLPESEALAADA